MKRRTEENSLRIIKSFCILPRVIDGKSYRFCKLYIIQKLTRIWYPGDYFTEKWEDVMTTSKFNYKKWKTGKLKLW